MIDRYLLEELHSREKYEVLSKRYERFRRKSRFLFVAFVASLVSTIFLQTIDVKLGLAAVFVTVAFLVLIVAHHGGVVSARDLKNATDQAELEYVDAKNKTIQYMSNIEEKSSFLSQNYPKLD